MAFVTNVGPVAFTGLDGSDPAGFTQTNNVSGAVRISGNKYHVPYGNPSDMREDTGTYTNDQWASCVLSGFSGGNLDDRIGVTVRQSAGTGGAEDCYRGVAVDGGVGSRLVRIVRVDNATETTLGSQTLALADNDVLRLAAVGSTITLYVNGTQQVQVTDATYSTGRPGITGKQGGNASLRGDDALFGDVVTAPVLTSPSATVTGNTTADISVTTDGANGVLYAVVTRSATQPTAAQIVAQQDHTGTTAASAPAVSITSAGTKTFSGISGLQPATQYWAHFVHRDAGGADSNIATTASFTTTGGAALSGSAVTGGSGAYSKTIAVPL